jgi:putative hydrolase of the HAD superfamily
MKQYRHLFFDLDHTLWDHDSNANHTLADLYHEFRLDRYQRFEVDELCKTFHEVNHGLWHDYHRGKVDKHQIRGERFRMVMEILEIPDFKYFREMGARYLEICPRKGNLMPHTIETLEYLKEKYPMTIITNGFDAIQEIKLTSSGIDQYFEAVITSEKAGWLKPHRGIFDFATEQVAVSCRECIMIGDNPVTDIAGARNSGIDQVYFNSKGIDDQLDSTYHIQSLMELRDLL